MAWVHRYVAAGRFRLYALTLLFVGLPAMPLSAQEAVGGLVLSAETQQPLAGASVVVVGTTRGTLTNAEGRFLIPGLGAGQQVTLRISMIGYRSETVESTAGDLDIRVSLSETAIELDRIVVTGTAGRQTKRGLGNTVATVNAAEVVQKTPVHTIAELLNGRSPGVAIIQTTGMLGGGNRVRIRGSNSFSLSNEPLVYVDGVRVNADQSTGPISQGFGSRPISRWNDLNPEDIESIEIIKGPAAATLYGTEAAGGVIQIITKKGNVGAPVFNLSIRQGADWWNPEDKLWTNYFDVGGDGTVETLDIVDLEEQRLDSCTDTEFFTSCPVRSIWRTGHIQQYDLSVSGGGSDIRYYIAGNHENSTGVDWDNDLTKYGGRANVTVSAMENLEIGGNIGYTTGRTNLAWEAGGGGATWTTFFARPDRLGTVRRGFWSFTPEMYTDVLDVWQDLQRTTLSFNLEHRPFDFLSHRLNVGRDYTRTKDVELVYHDERYLDLWSFLDRGYKQMWDRSTDYTTADYSATATLPVTPDVQSSTSVGGQYYRRYEEYVYAYGEGFPVPGLTSMSATTQNRFNGEYSVENVTVGVYLQEQLAWRNRLFLTAALRADDNSAFGEDFDFVTYPKISSSWVISEEPFWTFSPINTLKLRAAYGESGQQPDAFVALRTFDPVTGPDDVGTVTPENLGNPELGPERGHEIELGFDAALFDDRVGMEVTYYNQRTTDAILLREIAPSTGFSGSQFVNAGEIKNTGFELLLRGQPWRTDRHELELVFNVSTNNNEVVELGDFTDENFISVGSYNRHQIGYPVGAWFSPRVVSAQLDANGVATNLMCDNGSGGSMPCDDPDVPAVYLGNVSPEIEGGFSATLNLFDRLTLFSQVDFKAGFSKLDGNLRVRCFFFAECEENWFPERFDPVRIAEIQDAGTYVDVLVNEADFAKLRELSLTYEVPSRWAEWIRADRATISVAGRNLGTWTKFEGLEPESSFNSGSRGGSSLWEQNVLPQLTQFLVSVNLSF